MTSSPLTLVVVTSLRLDGPCVDESPSGHGHRTPTATAGCRDTWSPPDPEARIGPAKDLGRRMPSPFEVGGSDTLCAGHGAGTRSSDVALGIDMTSPSPVPDVEVTETRSSWFTRPLAAWACVLGWCVATGVFVACVALPGGPAVGDAFELIYPTWAFSHGQLVCMYPPHPLSISTFAAPVYPIIAGSIGFVANVGGSVPFPWGPCWVTAVRRR